MARERPILFSAPMVRALLAGQKTQTRRLASARHPVEFIGGKGEEDDPALWGYFFDGPERHGWAVLARGLNERFNNGSVSIHCPYGEPGDRLWVRETCALENCGSDGQRVVYAADRAAAWVIGPKRLGELHYLESSYEPVRWRPSIHMPRWFARLTLEVAEVRVERLQNISEEDARAEGMVQVPSGGWGLPEWTVGCTSAAHAFRALWGSIHGPGSWDTNPWVWAVSFRRLVESAP